MVKWRLLKSLPNGEFMYMLTNTDQYSSGCVLTNDLKLSSLFCYFINWCSIFVLKHPTNNNKEKVNKK